MSEFLSKGKDQIPTLSGIKFTSNDLDEGAKCLRVHEELTVFLGADTVSLIYFNTHLFLI